MHRALVTKGDSEKVSAVACVDERTILVANQVFDEGVDVPEVKVGQEQFVGIGTDSQKRRCVQKNFHRWPGPPSNKSSRSSGSGSKNESGTVH